jgi:hypothetical protein
MQSLTPFPVSFDGQAFVLEETQFAIEPISFADLPEGVELSVRVAFSTVPRENDFLGDVESNSPFFLEQHLAIVLHLHIFRAMPIPYSSRGAQCHNMNSVSCEFRFGEAQFANVLQRAMIPGASIVSAASPASGLLSPSAFQNLEIAGAPLAETCY